MISFQEALGYCAMATGVCVAGYYIITYAKDHFLKEPEPFGSKLEQLLDTTSSSEIIE